MATPSHVLSRAEYDARWMRDIHAAYAEESEDFCRGILAGTYPKNCWQTSDELVHRGILLEADQLLARFGRSSWTADEIDDLVDLFADTQDRSHPSFYAEWQGVSLWTYLEAQDEADRRYFAAQEVRANG